MSRGLSLCCRRFLVATLAVLAVGFFWRSEQMRDQRQAVRSLKRQKNLIVHYDYQWSHQRSGLMNYNPRAKPLAPPWLREVLGDDFLYGVAYLEVARPYPPEEAVEEFLARLPDCPVVYQ